MEGNLTAKHEQQPNIRGFGALGLGRNVYSLKEHDVAVQWVNVKGNSKHGEFPIFAQGRDVILQGTVPAEAD